MKRREARNEAFLLIFEMDFNGETAKDIIECAQEGRELSLDKYATKLFSLTFENRALIDSKISAHLNNWKIERLPKTTLAILRLAICELDNFEDIPVKVTINESVELAKTYSTQEDAAYINGVLGSYVKAAELTKKPEELSDGE